MFTGIIEEIGVVTQIVDRGTGLRLTIKTSNILNAVKSGDSISTEGVCLTVLHHDTLQFTADVMSETVRMTHFSKLTIGSFVNLERAMLAGGRFDGHMVSGHIDGVGSVMAHKKEHDAIWIAIQIPNDLLPYVILKGSIAIDGASLTVARLEENTVWVSLIPHTQKNTTLFDKKVGQQVNIECDPIGKYVERILGFQNKSPKGITIETLNENGFL